MSGLTGNKGGGKEELLFGKPRQRGSIKSCSKREEVVRPLDEHEQGLFTNTMDGEFSEEKEGDRTTLAKIFCLKNQKNLAKHGPDAEDQSKVFLSRR